jgi:hypothetical protein
VERRAAGDERMVHFRGLSSRGVSRLPTSIVNIALTNNKASIARRGLRS